jgi:hypothetical protein
VETIIETVLATGAVLALLGGLARWVRRAIGR